MQRCFCLYACLIMNDSQQPLKLIQKSSNQILIFISTRQLKSMSYRSSRSRSRSQTPVKVRENGQNQNQNCKVYVSNIHRDASDEEIRELFEKFGLITYFELKRKPGDIIYSFLEYKSPDAAGEAVEKMNRTNFLDRTLNVQFGKGGKHQQKHYETIQIQPSRSREHSEIERRVPDEKYPRRPYNLEFSRKKEKGESQIYAIGNNQRRRYNKSVSPPIQLSYRHKKQYREERPQRDQIEPKYQRQRQLNNRYPQARRPEADKQRRGQRHPSNYSPRGERRPYQEGRRYQETLRYEERRIYDEKRREPEESRRQERFRNQSHERRDKGRNFEQKRKPDHRQERYRDRFRDERPYKRQKYERQSSPQSRRNGRTNREYQRKTTRYDDDRHRYQQRHDRGGYERERQQRRSRSRQRSPYKHKFQRHQRERYQNQQYRRQTGTYERQHVQRHPRKEERRRHSRSDSPRKASPAKGYKSPKISIGYPKDSYKRYQKQQPRSETLFRNEQTSRHSLSQKGKRSEGVETYRKSQRMSQDSRSVSPQSRSKEREPFLERKYSFSSEKEKSPNSRVKNETKIQNEVA